MKFFAYGSNLSSERLRGRAPSAKYLGRARLEGYCLRFHKRSSDGSAKANALFTGRSGDCLWGAVFTCTEEEKEELDRVEGLGKGYDEAAVTVLMDGGRRERVRMYVAHPETIDESLLPYTWYWAYVMTGALEQGLPPEHLDVIRRQEAVRDADAERDESNTPAA